ncbi:DUF6265 family protein [Novosphingobium piscinae]|uniref:DUF6265 domain-containing protein n=1 Tax=Novosphingobium piscinae TaxID=1507448 RepID=A0A7X1KPP3_9SPHN|nr:DUF6265 family protein [Novosphingobium piscinae]MBC2668668.1 hypothetical protein [Novosphingobium piscinae]
MLRLPPSLFAALLIPLALVHAPVPLAAQPRETRLPEWMAGTWHSQSGAAWGDRLWTAPHGGQMLGLARRGFGPEVESWDYQRIVRRPGGGLSLMVQPQGGSAVDYAMAVMSDQAIEFANPSAPYPQRIRFWREGQLLMVEASQLDGSRAERWNYRPVAGPPPDGLPPERPALQSP